MEAWSFDDDADGAHVGETVGEWKKRRTPLMAAASKGHAGVVLALLELGASVNQVKSDDGATAFTISVQEGHAEVVRLLLEKGAEHEVVNTMRPLVVSAGKGHVEVVRLLLAKGAAVNQERADLSGPLLVATHEGHVDTVRLLMENRADMNQMDWSQMTDFDSDTKASLFTPFTPLFIATHGGHIEVVQLLLDYGAAVNTPTVGYVGCPNPLHKAVEDGQVEIAQVLLAHGADVNHKDALFGGSPLHRAVWCGQVAAARLLLANGAAVDLETNEHFHETPLCAMLVLIFKPHSEATLILDRTIAGLKPAHE
jgi:ankyrin repeat protein